MGGQWVGKRIADGLSIRARAGGGIRVAAIGYAEAAHGVNRDRFTQENPSMKKNIISSQSGGARRVEFANLETIIEWLLASPLADTIQDMLAVIDVEDCYIGGPEKSGGIVLDSETPDGGYELAAVELGSHLNYLVIGLPKRTQFPAGVRIIDLGLKSNK